MPFVGGVDIDEQGAKEADEDELVGLDAEVAAVADASDDSENQGERAPSGGDPDPVTFAVGNERDEDGRSGRVELGGIDGEGGRFVQAEPARAKLEESDDEGERDEAGGESGVGVTGMQMIIDVEGAEESRESD